jgi:hypothetical protein
MADDFMKEIYEITPYRWDATCPRCRHREFVTSNVENPPDPEVCTTCGNGVMKWKRTR